MTKPAELMHNKRYNTINFILRLIYPMSLLFAIVFLSFTCSNKYAEKGYQQSVDNSISIPTKREFSMPFIPDSIKRPEHRAEYKAIRFILYNKYNFHLNWYVLLLNRVTTIFFYFPFIHTCKGSLFIKKIVEFYLEIS